MMSGVGRDEVRLLWRSGVIDGEGGLIALSIVL
jgi:hypothetical protein